MQELHDLGVQLVDDRFNHETRLWLDNASPRPTCDTTLHVLADPNLGYRFYAALARVLYRGDHMKLDDANWHCFTLSRYDRSSGKWAMEKAPVYHIID